MVILRSRSDGNVRLAITPGTVHPKPMSIGTMLRPDKPIFLRSLSITKATRAIYPVSSSKDKKKNNTIIIGRKLSTLPTPAKIPSMINDCKVSLTPIFTSRLPVAAVTASTPISTIPCSHAPITLKVR